MHANNALQRNPSIVPGTISPYAMRDRFPATNLWQTCQHHFPTRTPPDVPPSVAPCPTHHMSRGLSPFKCRSFYPRSSPSVMRKGIHGERNRRNSMLLARLSEFARLSAPARHGRFVSGRREDRSNIFWLSERIVPYAGLGHASIFGVSNVY